jgi:PKD repeat protein
VDGVDETANFDKSFNDPFSSGKVMNYTTTSPTPPGRVVMLFTGAGGRETLLFTADFTALVSIPPFLSYMPTVDWSNLPAFGNTTTTFHFTDSSTGRNVTGFFWNFNEGSPSNAKNSDHIFASCGNDYCQYHINHSATDSPGTPWSLTAWLNRSLWVTVYKDPAPTATFTQNVTWGMVPFAVKFTATPSGPILVNDWYWTFGDGGTSTSQNPIYTYISGGTYTVTLKASNYTLGYTTVTGTVRANVTASPTWYNCAWGYRRNITLFNKSVSGSLSSFPVLIGLASDSSLGAHARGGDILFTKSDGVSIVPYEIEKFTTGSGALAAWVNVESIAYSSPNVTLYMYYGSDSTGPENGADVWDNSYKGVWHLNQSGSGVSGEFRDSTSNSNHGQGGSGAGANTPTRTDSGKIGYGQSFDGADWIKVANNATLQPTTAITISGWINLSSFGSGTEVDPVLRKGEDQPNNYQLKANDRYATLNLNGYDDDPPIGSTYLSTYTWYYFAGTWQSGSLRTVYLNGDPDGTGSFTGPIGTDNRPVYLGGRSGEDCITGKLDEVRISNVARTSQWIKTEYTNQASPSLFHYLMAQEENPSPCQGAG